MFERPISRMGVKDADIMANSVDCSGGFSKGNLSRTV